MIDTAIFANGTILAGPSSAGSANGPLCSNGSGGTTFSSAANIRTFLGLGIADSPTFAGVTAPLTGTVNGVTLTTGGSATAFLNGAGSYVSVTVPTPGGSSTELQYRSGATTFGAVTASSWDGTTLVLPVTRVLADAGAVTLRKKTNATGSLYFDFLNFGGAEVGYFGYGAANWNFYVANLVASQQMIFYNAGAMRMNIGTTGTVGVPLALVSQFGVTAETAGTIGEIILGAASQTAPLLQLQGLSSTSAARAHAELDTAAIDNTDATRKYRAIHRAYDTAAREYARGWGDGSVGRIAVAAPASAPTDAHLAASQISFYLDESGHNLLIRAKYADGTTYKLATIALA